MRVKKTERDSFCKNIHEKTKDESLDENIAEKLKMASELETIGLSLSAITRILQIDPNFLLERDKYNTEDTD